jgi:hypothetical protein
MTNDQRPGFNEANEVFVGLVDTQVKDISLQ